MHALPWPARYRHNRCSQLVRPARRLVACTMAVVMAAVSVASPLLAARKPAVRLIRDAEIEGLMRRYSRPIFKAAGIRSSAVHVYLINNENINAFVAGGQRIFIHTGLLVQAKTPNEVIGVLAHETGHIAGGHLARLGKQLDKASNIAIISMLLGAAAAVGGSIAGSSGTARAGQGILLGGQGIARRTVLTYLRAQESSADQAAIKFLERSGQSGKGVLNLFYKLSNQALASARYTSPYMRSHPMPLDRIRNLRRMVKKSRYYTRTDPPGLMFRHQMMRAKLVGFLYSPRVVYRRYPRSDKSLPSRYAHAIAAFRIGDIKNALPDINFLIRAIPKNPYFHELKGQALLEGGRPKAALAPLQRAVRLSPKSELIRLLLAQAQLASGGKANAAAALKNLIRARRREDDSPRLHSYMAIAYSKLGNRAMADLETAEAALRSGDGDLAIQKAKSAVKRFKRKSPAWLRAKDILNFAKKSKKKRGLWSG